MIESKQLRCFVAVAEHLHFGRAAASLGIVQSALSAQIKKLEADLGVRLINRQKRAAASLTDAGAMFLPEARAALDQIARADRTGRLAGRGELGHLDLGYVASAAVSGLLSNSLARFRPLHPQVQIRALAMETPNQLRAISEGRIDVGFTRTRNEYPIGVVGQAVHRDDFRIAISLSNPLAGRSTIHARDLKDQPFIMPQFAETGGFRQNLDDLGLIGGYSVETSLAVADFITAISLAAAGYGVALVPGSFERLRIEGAILRKIEDYDATTTLVMAWRSATSSPAVRAFVDSTLSAFRI